MVATYYIKHFCTGADRYNGILMSLPLLVAETINKLRERALRLVYNDKRSSFRELLERDKSVAIHERNIQVLLTEIFKVKSGIEPEIMTGIFKFKDHSYDLRKGNCIERRIIKSCKYGNETVLNLGEKLWYILPENVKKLNLFRILKTK